MAINQEPSLIYVAMLDSIKRLHNIACRMSHKCELTAREEIDLRIAIDQAEAIIYNQSTN